MAVTTTVLSNPIGAAVVVDLIANATSEDDIRSGAATIFRMRLDNSANTATTYVKFYAAASATVGTSAPFMVIPVKAGKVLKVACGMGEGIAFATGICVAAVTTGGTAGTTDPAASVPIRLHTS